MTTSPLETVERLRGKPLSAEEKEILLRMKDELGCDDSDALWQMISVLEYQKLFYVNLPEKITAHTEKLLAVIEEAARKEAAIAQGKLVAGVVAGARNLNLKSRLSFLLLVRLLALIGFFLICSLMMWSGYMIGTGGTKPPGFILKIPSGLMIGLLCLGLAGVCAYLTVKDYGAVIKTWWRPLTMSAAATGIGAWFLVFSL